MTNLSKAQVALLKRLAEGKKLEEHSGPWLEPWLTWEGQPYMRPCVPHNMLPRLLNMGLVVGALGRDGRNAHNITVYAITGAGRAYLEGLCEE